MPLMHGRVLASGVMVPVNVDLDGDLQVDILAALPAGTNLIGDVQARNKGWVSSAWQKDPLRFGFSGIARDRLINTNLSAGTNVLNMSLVPSGEFWVITNLCTEYIGTFATVHMRYYMYDGANYFKLWEADPPHSQHILDRQGWWVLNSGDRFVIEVFNATAGDDLDASATGFRVDTDQ